MKIINIALLGYGVVGKALEEIYLEASKKAADKIFRLSGERVDFRLKWIFLRDLSRPIKSTAKKTADYLDILDDEEVHIVVELLGGLEPATSIMKEAMKRGKSVVSANKYAIYEAQGHLEALALERQVGFSYEAAVAAAIPLVDTLKNRFFIEEVQEITAILNGTTNYILSSMARGDSYEDALSRADQLGYLEADPSLDLDGFDSLHKIAILHKLAYGFYPKKISREGIGAARDKKVQGKLKLIARAREGRVSVCLEEVPKTSPFYRIDDGINALKLKTLYSRELFFSGPGAGGKETAMSVWSDILSQVRILG